MVTRSEFQNALEENGYEKERLNKKGKHGHYGLNKQGLSIHHKEIKVNRNVCHFDVESNIIVGIWFSCISTVDEARSRAGTLKNKMAFVITRKNKYQYIHGRFNGELIKNITKGQLLEIADNCLINHPYRI